MEGIAALSLENSRGNKKRKLDPQKKVRKLQLINEIFYRNGKVIQNFLAFFSRALEIFRQYLLLPTVKCYRKKLLGALENNTM